MESFIEGPRGIAFLPNGAYFLCGHKDGNVWYVDTAGVLHKYIQGGCWRIAGVEQRPIPLSKEPS